MLALYGADWQDCLIRMSFESIMFSGFVLACYGASDAAQQQQHGHWGSSRMCESGNAMDCL
jgi:hypothetical protein